jgi:hypothetical protein
VEAEHVEFVERFIRTEHRRGNADGLLNCSNSAGGLLGAAEVDDSNQSALWRPFLPALKDLLRTGSLPRPSLDRVDAPEPDEADRAAVCAAATAATEGTTALPT